MPRICYEPKNFGARRAEIIRLANSVLLEYEAQGYTLTLRQLYYQFVARDWLPNRVQSYNLLGAVVNEARLAGEIDWNQIVDRDRNIRTIPHYQNSPQAINLIPRLSGYDFWLNQPCRCEVWIEKLALENVIADPCLDRDVTYFSCKGYVSQSEMWRAAQRFGRYARAGQKIYLFHLGDHDPSGLDMSRDIEERLLKFIISDHWADEPGLSAGEAVSWGTEHFRLDRLALNWDQVQEYNPPPNPAKITDSRYEGYREEFGDESWELDALEPSILSQLVEDAISSIIDEELMEAAREREQQYLSQLREVGARWSEVEELLEIGNE